MLTFGFKALSTHWVVMVDVDTALVPDNFLSSIQKTAELFEQKYSRFKKNNLLAKLNEHRDEYSLDQNLYQMFSTGAQLAVLTDNHFTLSVAKLLEFHGYDAAYSLQPNPTKIKKFQVHTFKLQKHILKKSNPKTTFDLGSLGKGYLIDLIASQIKASKIECFLIDGGGDIFGTCKANGDPWKLALAHPKKDTIAIGTINIKHSALAVSGSDKRAFGSFHHLLNPKSKKPVNSLSSVYVHAPSALAADACATALFVSPQRYWDGIRNNFNIEYLALLPDQSFKRSKKFTGEIFTTRKSQQHLT